MNIYIGRVLGDGITPASQAQVDAARLGYWKRYGATLLGMIRHHGVSAADFLHVTHDLGALDKLVRAEKGWPPCCGACRAARSCSRMRRRAIRPT